MSSVHWLLKSKKSSVSIIAAQRMTDLKEISSWNSTPCNRVFFPLKYEVEYRLFFFYVLKLSLLSYMSFYFEWLGILGILRLFKKLTKPLVHAQFHLAYNQNFSTGTGEPVDYKNIIFDMKLIIHWSRDCACTDPMADHALIAWLIMHWSRG